MTTSPEEEEREEMMGSTSPTPSVQQVDGDPTAPPTKVIIWIVMATYGEWSDRVEFPMFAFETEAAAEAACDRFTAIVRAADARWPECPTIDDPDSAWDRYDAKVRRIRRQLSKAMRGRPVENRETTFFTYAVARWDGDAANPDAASDIPTQ